MRYESRDFNNELPPQLWRHLAVRGPSAYIGGDGPHCGGHSVPVLGERELSSKDKIVICRFARFRLREIPIRHRKRFHCPIAGQTKAIIRTTFKQMQEIR